MKRSASRILTTHTGSLPRSPGPAGLLREREERRDLDAALFDTEVRQAVVDVTAKQKETGIDVVNDGEQGRGQYATYVKERLTGFQGERAVRTARGWTTPISGICRHADPPFFPEHASTCVHRTHIMEGLGGGAAGYRHLPTNIRKLPVEEVFMTAASPGVIANFLPNEYYPTEEAYLYGLAEVMKDEYNAIVNAGLILQIDCPDLAMTRVSQFSHLSVDEFKKVVELHVEVINYALADIDPERMRLHLCWGNTEGPHHHDVPLKELVDLVLKARPVGLSFEGANPRHAHEWKDWQDVRLPEGKVLIPGVLDTTTNFIEHPELVAQRIVNYANIVGREKRYRRQRLRIRHFSLGAESRDQHCVGQVGFYG